MKLSNFIILTSVLAMVFWATQILNNLRDQLFSYQPPPRDLENKIFGFLPFVLIFVAKKVSFNVEKD